MTAEVLPFTPMTDHNRRDANGLMIASGLEQLQERADRQCRWAVLDGKIDEAFRWARLSEDLEKAWLDRTKA